MALADYSRAIRLDPQYVSAYFNRGLIYYEQGQPQRALADFDKVLEIDPKNERARKGREFIVKQQGGE